eukprot:gene12368-14316_t
MIRNRSQITMSSSPTGSDIENNMQTDGKGSYRTPWGTTLSRRFVYVLIGCLFIFLVELFLLNPAPLNEHRPTKAASHEQLTIVMNTFERHPLMLEAIDHYKRCPVVKHIYVVWSEKDPPPERIKAKFEGKVHPSVTFRVETEDSLNSRFRPIDGPHNDAIFSVDDDMRVPCADLDLAYEVWRGSQRSIVGFMPRVHIRRNGIWEYRCWWRVWLHGTYSIILTKAAILHHDYFAMYHQSAEQKPVRELVDRRWNCEDIAMQFLIANHTSLPPIYVKGNIDDKGVLGGISTNQNIIKAGHMHDRSSCLSDLEKIYGNMPLVSSRMIVDSAANGWTNRPSTVYEYLSSDLWKW